MKHWLKKGWVAWTAVFAVCFLFCGGALGAGASIDEDFEGASYIAGQKPGIAGFGVVDNTSQGGSVLIREESISGKANKYLELQKTVKQGQTSNDVYIQTKAYYDLTMRTDIGFQIRALPGSGSLNVSLRCSGLDAGSGTVTLVSFNAGAGTVTYGNEFAGSVTESCALTDWTAFMVELDLENDSIKIYRDTELKASLSGTRATSKLSNFNYDSSSLRFQEFGNAKVPGAVTTYHLDNLKMITDESIDGRFFVSGRKLYKTVDGTSREVNALKSGDLTATAEVKNTSSETQKARLAAAVYGTDGRIKGVFFSDTKTLAAGESATLDAGLSVAPLEEGDAMKVFLFDGNEVVLPVAKAAVYEQSNYTQPYDVEIIHDLKQQNPNQAHPRVMMTKDKLAFLQTAVKTQEPYKTWYAKVKASADNIKDSNRPSYNDNDELRLKAAGTAQDRLMKLAFVYSMETSNRDKYINQLWSEIKFYANKDETVTADKQWRDWNPKHFLDTSAMITGFGVAYDWCYDYWAQPENADKKQVLLDALVNLGLDKARQAYEGTLDVGNWWTTTDNNWSFVCNGGIAVGALAIGDEDAYTDMCGYLLEKGLRAIEKSIVHFAPDGAWYEGPGYWHYTVQFMSMYFSALQTATGTDYGYLGSEGIDKTAHFPIGVTGQTNTVNLHDAGESQLSPPELFYLAAQFGDTTAAKYRYYQLQTQNKTPTFKDILWYDESLIGDGALDGMQHDFAFRDIELMTFRNEYFTNNVFFAALHGGLNGINHGQIDAGNFVYEANGVRWAVDLGGDDYNLDGYFNNSNTMNGRWIYYRSRGEGHNTIILNPNTDAQKPADQPLDKTAVIKSYSPGNAIGTGEIDMQPIYGAYTDRATRAIRLDKTNGQCTITDKLSFKSGTENDLYWFMHTKAAISVAADGKSAVLTQNNKKLYVYLTQGNGTFEAVKAEPLESSPHPAGQNANTGIQKLRIHVPDASGEFALQVLLSPFEL